MSVTIGRLQLTVTVTERRAVDSVRHESDDVSDPAERAYLRHRCLEEVKAERDHWAARAAYWWGRVP
jgi:hypothetical protein